MYTVGITHNRVFEYCKSSCHDRIVDAGVEYRFIDEHGLDENVRTMVTGTLSAIDLTHYPNLEAVIVPFAAINQLDLAALFEKNIRIFHTTAHAHFVAERALALTLAVMGKIVYFHGLLKKGDWAGRVDGVGGSGKKWTSLFSKKVAIYGYGSVGKSLAGLLEPFGVSIGALSYKGRNVDGVQSFLTLQELANWSDVLIVTAPLNDQTENSIDEKILAALEGKVLVNIGRGPIINEAALFESLSAGRLGGLGSDVWYNYPTQDNPSCPPSQFPIGSFDNVVMTPHNGGSEHNADALKYEDVIVQMLQISKRNYSRQIRSSWVR